jgi:1,4-alpha-glucan branching enzyme
MAYEDEHFIDTSGMVWNYSLFSDGDIKAFAAGEMLNGYDKFGSHPVQVLGVEGYYFAVWAPNATAVSVIGEFNGWKRGVHNLNVRLDHSGIWEGFVPRLTEGLLYKYHIKGFADAITVKADPFARRAELRPGTASVLWKGQKKWNDHGWMENRSANNSLHAPWSVYELHLASWMRPKKNDEEVYNSYHQIAERLIPYLKGMGFTHVEFMPVMEYPYDGSWGYQLTGYFAPTSRFGTPDEFKDLVDLLHQNGIGVILDWVPSHFPADAHGLYSFDGTHTYEYADMRKGYHPDWSSYIFNYARGEVVSFLLSSAHFWMEHFHADGLRVDAVSSMIKLDFSRGPGAWEPNQFGGNENLEAIAFLQKLNKTLYKRFKGIQTIAEEATDRPGITTPVSKKGLGFGMKWMMGWMHDSFRYFKRHPADRPHHQDEFSFSMMYYYDEKFMLPLSHDEVVHGKSPMIYKMPGNEKEKFANLRLLYAYMFTHPGAKLLFMGNEFGQTTEWNFSSELDWELLQYPVHEGLQTCVRDLNMMYRSMPALYEFQFERKGFEWLVLDRREEGIMAYRRMGRKKADELVVILNTSAKYYNGYRLKLGAKKIKEEVFNSDHSRYGGTGAWLNSKLFTESADKKSGEFSCLINIPALSAMVFK